MTVQVLVVTMNQPKGDYSLLEKMNIQSDAIVCNQCDRYDAEEFTYNGHKIKWFSFSERGVGLNRNNALMRCSADICILADDDMVFCDNYSQIVLTWFDKLKDADILLLNIERDGKLLSPTQKIKRVKNHNFGRYGAARMVLRTDRIKLFGIYFNTMFGGGCTYSCGEDSLFLSECINKGLKSVAIPQCIAKIFSERESTWFEGYTDKFFFDKGVLYYAMNKKLSVIFSLYHCLRHRKRYKEYGWYKAFKQMNNGINSVKK